MCDTECIIRESSGSGCSESMDQAVKKIHPSKQKKDDLDHCQSKVHSVQDPGICHHLRRQLILLRSRHLCSHQDHGIFVKRCQHHNKYQHAHSSDPVCKAAPEQHPLRKRLHICQHCGTGRSESGDCFKQGV